MRYDTAILGAGPAGVGLLVCAAQRGTLEPLLDRGVVMIERGDAAGVGELAGYDLNSDSLATSFVECLEAAPARRWLGEVAALPVARELIGLRDRHAPLPRVARFLGAVGRAMRGELERHPRCAFLASTTVRSISLRQDGSFSIEVAGGAGPGAARRIEARAIVLALGGRQDRDAVLRETVAGVRLAAVAERVAPSDPFVRHGGLDPVRERLREGTRVAIVGGSHSAFSVAWVLIERLPRDVFERGGITILHRGPLRIFYPTPAAATADGYEDFDASAVCPRTGRVHRLGGLRGDGRALWRRVTGRLSPRERRVKLMPIDERSAAEAARLLAEADLVVPAFGYRPRTVPLLDSDGVPLPLRGADGGPLVGPDARVALADGTPLPSAYGIGMASGFLPPGEPSFHGPVNGVWLYHNVYGERILDALGA